MKYLLRLQLSLFLSLAILALTFVPRFFAWNRNQSDPQQTWRERTRAALSETKGEFRLAGLEAPVDVLRDEWGVPHIYARNQHDLFFAQGFVAAQDRLFQMELWKRAGQGRLAEVAGESFLPRDVAARLLRYRGPLQTEYASYAADTQEILGAFTDGINSYIQQRSAPGGPGLPIEFQLASFAPEPWKPEDCLTRMATLSVTGNAEDELANAQLVVLLGPEKAAALGEFDPATHLEPAAGLDFSGFSPELIAGMRGTETRVEFPTEAARGKREMGESNNWSISGKLTMSGKPLVANDPHRTIALPSMRYIVHLVAPGWDVIGATEPAMPGVSIGHNQNIAWGLTVFPVDQQDFYLEELNPRDPLEYKAENGWRKMRVEEEIFKIRGGKSRSESLKFTRHGAVMWSDGKWALALHWVGDEPGTAPYLTGISVDRAQNWQQFLQAMARWKTPPENFVYGDREGNIGEQSSGLVPIRSKGNGLLPVPGTRGYEWTGFIPFSDLPRQFNPERGYVATANNKTIPDNYRYAAGFLWSRDRIARIEQVLNEAREKKQLVGPEEMARLQNDVVSLPAQKLLHLISEPVDLTDAAARLFAGWDGSLREESAAAALYEVWLVKLRDALVGMLLPNRGKASFAIDREYIPSLFIHAAPELFGANARTKRDAMLRSTLHTAYAELQETFGPDSSKWSWGHLHTVRFRHALDRIQNSEGIFDLGPFARPGDESTVDATDYPEEGYAQVAGASYREILDLSDWDDSEAVNAPGQSGQPGSAHYSDLLPLWRDGRYFPLLYTRASVERKSAERLTLLPTKR